MLLVGLLELPVKQLAQPSWESRLLREADPTFVENLKQKMLADPSAPGSTLMVVLCKDLEVMVDSCISFINHDVVLSSDCHVTYCDWDQIHQ